MALNLAPLHRRPSLSKGLLQAALGAVLSLSTAVIVPRASAADSAAATGVVTGNVTNKTTGNGLIGAKVEIPALSVSALVDNTGRFLLNVAPGTHELVVTYTGLDTQRTTVNVSVGQPALRNFDMSSSVLMLDAFKVASQKEGLSSALTQQRNADNLKNVASMDALADLPNMNATELAIRLPGVTFGDPGDEVVETISVRGMGGNMTSITIDGGGMSSFGALGRTTRMTSFTGNMFESLELTKGQTPDRSVDSLGGGVNFKTRSPLSMREKRRISYSLTPAVRTSSLTSPTRRNSPCLAAKSKISPSRSTGSKAKTPSVFSTPSAISSKPTRSPPISGTTARATTTTTAASKASARSGTTGLAGTISSS